MSTPEQPTAERPDDQPPSGGGAVLGVVVPTLALVALVGLAATGAGLLLPGADLSPVATLVLRLSGAILVVAGVVALGTRWGRGARVKLEDIPVAVAIAVVIFGTLAALSVAHSDVGFSGEEGELPSSTLGTTTSTVESTTSTTDPPEVPTSEVEEQPPLIGELDRVDLLQLLLVLLIATLLVVALAGLLPAWGIRPRWRRGRALPVTRPETPVDAEAAEAGLAASLAVVVEGDDPRSAIVAAYARLLEALARAGGARRPEEAPHEHLYRVLGPLGVRPEPVHELAELFVMARFSDHDITDTHRAQAVTLLETALADLRATAAAAASTASTDADAPVAPGTGRDQPSQPA